MRRLILGLVLICSSAFAQRPLPGGGTFEGAGGSYQLLSEKNAASGYAGLTAGTKLTLAHGQEVWAIADLTDASGTTGSGGLVAFQTSPVFLGTPVIGAGSGNVKLEFAEEATNPTCGAGAYYIWANSADLKLKKCENGSITDLAPAGGAVAFSAITAGTNANALVVGTGGTFGFSGTGTIDANRFKGLATIAVADGGTNKTAWTQYAIPYASTTAIISEVNIGTAAQCLQVNGTATGYLWGSCGGGSPTIQNNGTAVGSRPIINFIPGTGMSYTITDNPGATRVDVTQGIEITIVPRFASAGTFTAKQTFPVTGGIAAFGLTPGIAPTTTLTAGDFYVNSTSQKVFHYNGAAFVQLMDNKMTVQGDITTAGASGAEQRLALGATGTFLYSNGTDPIWRQPLASDITNAYDVNIDQAIGAHFIDVTNIAPPANPAATRARVYFRTSTAKLACIDSAGADCMPAAGGASATYREFIAGTCQLGVAGLTFSLPTTLAPTATCVTGTNTNYAVATFPDAASLYSVQGRFFLPSTWTGAIDLTITWRTTETNTVNNVAFQWESLCNADGVAPDAAAFNTAQVITDAAKGTANLWNTVTQTSITMTGCSAGQHLLFKLGRDRGHASDTIGAFPVEIISIMFKMTV